MMMEEETLDYEPETIPKSWSEAMDDVVDLKTPVYEPIKNEGFEIYYSKCIDSVRQTASEKIAKMLPTFSDQRNYFNYAKANVFLKDFLKLLYFNRKDLMHFFSEDNFFIKVDNSSQDTTTVSMFFTWNTFGIVYTMQKIDENNALLATFAILMQYVIANENFVYPEDFDTRPNGGYKNGEIFEFLIFLIKGCLDGHAITKLLQNNNQKWVKTKIGEFKNDYGYTTRFVEVCTPNLSERFNIYASKRGDRRFNNNMKLKHAFKNVLLRVLDKM